MLRSVLADGFVDLSRLVGGCRAVSQSVMTVTAPTPRAAAMPRPVTASNGNAPAAGSAASAATVIRSLCK